MDIEKLIGRGVEDMVGRSFGQGNETRWRLGWSPGPCRAVPLRSYEIVHQHNSFGSRETIVHTTVIGSLIPNHKQQTYGV